MANTRSRERTTTIVNVGYQSTNYWVVSSGASRLLIDLGYPGTIGTMRSRLERTGVPLRDIRYSLATHYHIDHAGLAQELKNAGVPLLVVDVQLPFIARMKQWTKPVDGYVDIETHDNRVITCDESRAVLRAIGIDGQILATPGHSDDSVSLLLDDGSVFMGDLTLPGMASEADLAMVASSWRLLREHGAVTVYPGHGPPYPMARHTG